MVLFKEWTPANKYNGLNEAMYNIKYCIQSVLSVEHHHLMQLCTIMLSCPDLPLLKEVQATNCKAKENKKVCQEVVRARSEQFFRALNQRDWWLTESQKRNNSRFLILQIHRNTVHWQLEYLGRTGRDNNV